MNASDVIVIYPGRFHPFHKGHKGVFDLLNSKFKNVFIATSDKVEAGKSPFSFDEKVKIMNLTGVEQSNILKVKQTYNGEEYKSRFNNNYGLIFAVSEKDMSDDPRFNFPSSGMSLKKNGEPAYLQKFTSMDKVDNMEQHGYIMTVPTTSFKVNGHDVNSASQIRSLLGTENIDDAKQAFVDLYDKYNETVFNMIRNKLGEKTMENIDLNELRRMAGLEERDIDQDDDYSEVPGYKEKPMFDQLGKIIDSYDMSQEGDDIKNPLSTVKTDDGEEIEVNVGEARALKDMMEMLSSARMGQDKSAREKFLDTIQKSEGLHGMLEFARSKGLVKEEYTGEGNAFGGAQVGKKKGDKFTVGGKTFTKEEEIEELNLDDIRADYGINEGRLKDVIIDAMQMTKEEFDMEYKGEFDYDEINADFGEDSLDQEPAEIGEGPDYDASDIHRGDAITCKPCGGKGCDHCDQKGVHPKEESTDPQAEQGREEEAYEDLMKALQDGGEEAYAKACDLSMEDLDDELGEISRDLNLHMDDDRDEIIHRHAKDTCENAEYKDHGEPAVDEDLQRMRHLAGLDEAGTKTVNGCTVYSDGSPLSFLDWREATETETGHQMKRSPEDQKMDYQSYVNRCKG